MSEHVRKRIDSLQDYLQDNVQDTEAIPLNTWCPECGGPSTDERAAMMYCVMHMPTLNTGHVGFFRDAGGEDNKAVCDFLHRGEIKEIHPHV